MKLQAKHIGPLLALIALLTMLGLMVNEAMGAIRFDTKYGVERTFDFELYDSNDPHVLDEDAAHAAGDTKIRKNGGAEGNTSNAFTDEGATYSITLTAAELTAERIVVYIKDQSGPALWMDQVIIIDTYGDSNAPHEFDIDNATPTVDATKVSGDSTAADNIEDFWDETNVTSRMKEVWETDFTTAYDSTNNMWNVDVEFWDSNEVPRPTDDIVSDGSAAPSNFSSLAIDGDGHVEAEDGSGSALATSSALSTASGYASDAKDAAEKIDSEAEWGAMGSVLVDNIQAAIDNNSILANGTYGLSAIRSRGDAAWITATGFSTLTASDNIGINWADISNPTATVGFTNTTVGTVTANTDMRGTDNAALAATAVSNATWTDAKAGYIDASIATASGYASDAKTAAEKVDTEAEWADLGSTLVDNIQAAIDANGLMQYWTQARAAMIDNLNGFDANHIDQDISAVTATFDFTDANWTDLVGYVDDLETRLSAARAAMIDNLNGLDANYIDAAISAGSVPGAITGTVATAGTTMSFTLSTDFKAGLHAHRGQFITITDADTSIAETRRIKTYSAARVATVDGKDKFSFTPANADVAVVWGFQQAKTSGP